MAADEGSTGSFADLLRAATEATAKGLGDTYSWGPRIALEMLFGHVRGRVVGRRVGMETAAGALAFTLSEVSAQIDPMAAAMGHVHDVSVSLRDIEFAGRKFGAATAAIGNVRTLIGARPAVACSPIDLTVDLTDEQVSELVQRSRWRIAASCMETGRVRLRLRRHPVVGWLEVFPEVVDGQLALRLLAVGRDRWNLPLGRRIPARLVPVKLPPGARVTAVNVEPASLSVDIRLDRWRFEYGQILG